MAKIECIDYTSLDICSFSVIFARYFKDVYGREPIDFLEVKTPGGVEYTSEIQQKLYEYQEEGVKIKLAYAGTQLIGFMVYNLVFGLVLVCRAIYLDPEFRNGGYLRRLIYSAGSVKRVISVTFPNKEPKEIKGEKKSRTLLGKFGGMNVWENITR